MDAKIILCISRIDYQKNQKILVKLMARLEQANHHLLLIGPITSQWYYNELLKMAQDLNVTDKLTIIPGLPPDSPQLLQALAQASCFILPSIHEPFGIAALEAMDAQLPLIAAKVGGLQDFLKHDENALLFASDNLDELYHCWQTLQKQDRHASALIKNGLETARRFDWQHLAKHLLKIYEELP